VKWDSSHAYSPLFNFGEQSFRNPISADRLVIYETAITIELRKKRGPNETKQISANCGRSANQS